MGDLNENIEAKVFDDAVDKEFDDDNPQELILTNQILINHLRLLTLRDEVKQAILDGRLAEGHARTLVALPYEDQLEGLHRILNNKMSVREAEKATREVVAKKNLRPSRFDPEAKAMEDEIAGALGTKVDVKKNGGTGQIIIKFFSNDELRAITSKIVKN